jgi:hypothetical protein
MMMSLLFASRLPSEDSAFRVGLLAESQSSGIPNARCAVRPPERRRAAIPVDAHTTGESSRESA